MKIQSGIFLLILSSILALSLFANGAEQDAKQVSCAGRCVFKLTTLSGWATKGNSDYDKPFSGVGFSAHEAMTTMHLACEDWAQRVQVWHKSQYNEGVLIKNIEVTSSNVRYQNAVDGVVYKGFSLDDCQSTPGGISILNSATAIN